MNIWHVWTIAQQRYKRVKEFLENLNEIDDYFYPTVVKEYNTKSGKKTKDVPLFNNYIFIKYIHNDQLHIKISDNPWIKDYLGTCSQKEMEDVLELSNKRYEDLLPDTEIKKGHSYRLVGTPFRDMICTVVDVEEDKLIVAVQLFGSDRLIKCSTKDIGLER